MPNPFSIQVERKSGDSRVPTPASSGFDSHTLPPTLAAYRLASAWEIRRYGKVGKNAEAISAFKTALQIKPDFHDARYALGLAYLASGDQKAADAQARLLDSEDPKLAAELRSLIRQFKAAR